MFVILRELSGLKRGSDRIWICSWVQVALGLWVFAKNGVLSHGFMLSQRQFSHGPVNCSSSGWIHGFSKDTVNGISEYVKDLSKFSTYVCFDAPFLPSHARSLL